MRVLKDKVSEVQLLLAYLAFLIPMTVFVGLSIAFYTYAIQAVTVFRFTHPNILYALPFFGIAVVYIGVILKRHAVDMDLVVHAMHEPRKVPFIGGIYVYIATVLTHLFGASVGAEGTAVQFAASFSSLLSRFKLFKKLDPTILITMGGAAGFGAVFNVPLAGAFFACECLYAKRFNFQALLPCLLASFGAAEVRSLTGVFHPQYSVLSYAGRIDDFHVSEGNWKFWLLSLVAAVAFGLVAKAYTEGLHNGTACFKKICRSAYIRIFIGGVVTIALAWAIGTRAYLGLGVLAQYPGEPTIMNFMAGVFYPDSWFWKLAFSLVALCAGYKGGEVTVLFFIGAATGNALSHYFYIPADLLASAGMISVFAAASNTPITGFVLALELFGCVNGSYYFVVCYFAYLISNPLSSIYMGQRLLHNLEEGEAKLISLAEHRSLDK